MLRYSWKVDANNKELPLKNAFVYSFGWKLIRADEENSMQNHEHSI